MNPIQATYGGGGSDAFVAKINAAGSALLYSTYLGGGEDEEVGHSAVDACRNAYVPGNTTSSDFPTVNPLQASLSASRNAFVAKLNPAGRALVYSTYLDEDAATAIAVDAAGSTYVTGLGAFVAKLCEVTVEAIIAPVAPVQVNTPISVSADFIDQDPLSTPTATWDWGDNSTSPGIVDDIASSVSGNHVYTTAGVYTVTLTVTNQDGCSGQAVFQFVVVYDPSAGFVTGGGWIDSPVGAYTLNFSLAGKATFGFVSKYQKGATVPTGQTEFQFRVANLNFHSTSYQWLVIAWPKAKYKGSGTINNSGDYGFMLTATDGQVNGGGGVDKFRIKIWDKATSTVVYDNQLNDPEDADATDAIEGGSIVIHK
ncbi:MAG: PKD domain-containing protein [Deltaproteobacteria bacterium]|nr:PKD domain-containing protein [Deltaproteobacteria bacterium]